MKKRKVNKKRVNGQGSKVKGKAQAPKSKVKIKKLPKVELKKYKLLLLKERAQVGGDLSHIAENTLNKSQRDATGSLSGYAYHMADQASDDYDRDFSLGIATEEQKLLYTIDEALRRIADGTYGSCISCGKLIVKRRLKAIPHTALCIECQKDNEVR